MLKQFAILGIVLLIAGGIGLVRTLPYHPEWTALGLTPKSTLLADRSNDAEAVEVWPVAAPKNARDFNDELIQLQGISPEALKTQQEARLKADLERLAGGEKIDPGLARAMYGDNWQEKVAQHKSRKEQSEFILNGSFVLALLGLIVFTCCMVIGLVRLILRVARWLAGLITKALKKPIPVPQKAMPASSEETDADAVHIEESGRSRIGGKEKGRARISVPISTPSAPMEPVSYQRTYPNQDREGNGAEVPGLSWTEVPVEHLLSDEKTCPVACVQPVLAVTETDLEESDSVVHAEVAVVEETIEQPSDVDRTLAVQTADLERQLAQFKEKIQTVRSPEVSAGPESSEPFNRTLLQLNEQISAIREYASEQQQRVEKLQDGYDWTIIRTFCLRIIRCIDNLEDRIARLAEQGEATEHLDQVREELLFALESSGVEPFEPQLQSVFRGQERWAEAIKDKQPCDDPQLKGCVAAVIKPGYQYVVDEQNGKVVRTARVKLYG
jgi:molecular chaperone GrpE (heat shock protein)